MKHQNPLNLTGQRLTKSHLIYTPGWAYALLAPGKWPQGRRKWCVPRLKLKPRQETKHFSVNDEVGVRCSVFVPGDFTCRINRFHVHFQVLCAGVIIHWQTERQEVDHAHITGTFCRWTWTRLKTWSNPNTTRCVFISFPRSDRYGTSGSGPFLRGLDSSWSRCWRPLLSTFIFSWFLIPDFWISKLRHSSGIIIKTQMNQLLQDPGHRSVSVGEPFNPLMDGLQQWHWARLCSCVCEIFTFTR